MGQAGGQGQGQAVSDLNGERADAAAPRKSSLGTLGIALADVLARVQTLTVIVTTFVSITVAATVLPELAIPFRDAFGYPAALFILGVLGWSIFVLAIAVTAIVPPLLLRRRDRAVFAAHSWIGARESR